MLYFVMTRLGNNLVVFSLKYTVITLLGRPVYQLLNANIQSANHMAASKCIKACRCGQEVQLFFRSNVRIGKKCEASDFDCGMIVGARQGGLSISETADSLGFSLNFF